MTQVEPYGGKLINRVLEGAEREYWLERASEFPQVRLNARQLSDLESIAVGALSSPRRVHV